ncbi:TPA: S-type pyocin domain-containing protein [Yersinia enterocolitica]|uniref:S-type pyocin domain-containing protein n=1 Tax=Yersinia enterocolitica TaxID=630 RepID=UPI0005E5B12C|nr:S-type pyocin domain-containing protein [Yersinia enterocolitica]ELI8171078.1 S-type pyocin domain-containing protein [Yersinia enterocolitica]ELW7389066.1 S-type pyocin domain-containing protein [Yersinia enterocolitica]ELZ1907613.1 S-type pyocin domain-containing protein [Yersinia enterocolitica]EMA7648289.1 S-type pyocin domain-containing protein [Yersinia enterocolitica]CFB71193.1 colicin/pyocin immunity family protein [Yersinia enterocolitica]
MGEGHSNTTGHGARGPTGGVKGGPAGPGGPGSNRGQGWGTSQTPYGAIHHYSPSQFGHGSQRGGGRGGDRSSKAAPANLAQNPELQTYMAVGGMPAVITLIDGHWGVTLSRLPAVAAFIEGHLARVGSWVMRTSPVGVAVMGMMPSRIASDPPIGQFFTTSTLPANRVTDTPKETLKVVADAAVNIRISDVTEEGVQKAVLIKAPIAIQRVPVIKAITTTRPDVFTAAIPGITPIHISVVDTMPINIPAPTQPAARPVVTPIENAAPQEFSLPVGRHSRDAIIVFPDSTGIEPLYLSVIRITNSDELMQEARNTYEKARREREAAERAMTHSFSSALDKLKLKKTLADKQVTETAAHIILLESHIPLLKQEEANIWQQYNAFGGRDNKWAFKYRYERRDLRALALVKQEEVNAINYRLVELRAKYETLLVLQQSVNAELGIAEQQRIENERLAAEAAQWQQRVENARLSVEASFAAERQHIEDGWRVFEVAEKDAQLAAEAAQWQQRVKNARLAIEATFAAERQRIEDRWLAVEAEAAIRNNTFSLIAYMAEDERFPGFSASGAGSVTFSYREAIKLDASLQRVLRRFSWHNSALADPLVFPIGTVFYSNNERQGTELPPLAGSFPLGYMLSHETSLPQQGEVNSPVRILMVDRDDETRIYAVKTGVADVPANVKVGMAQFDRTKGVYTFTTDTLPPRTFTFTSPRPPGVGGVSVIPQPASAPVFPQHTGTDIKILATRGTLTFLAHEEVSFHDYIIWFPAGSGLEPVYVYFKSPRDEPGEVTGEGEWILGIWLAEAGRGQGAAIPAQIADKLRGREFSSFDRFREAFWRAVANDPELSGQFIELNQRRMREKGYSPFTPSKEKVGGRDKFELHHVISIKDNGAIYDVDNLRVITPKRHIEIHSKNRGE